jgi:hypothetical protein
MSPSRFTLTPVERTAIETIREERPEVLVTFSRWVVTLLHDLGWTSQGRVMSEAEADELLQKLREEAVASLRTDLGSWGADEDVQEAVVDLLARYILVEARAGFVRQVLGATRN